MRLRKLHIFFSIIILFTSCFKSKVDFLEQSGDNGISVIRYDRLQSEYVSFDSFSALQKMNSTYAPITQILVEEILAIGDVQEEDINKRVKSFFSDTTLVRLIADVEEKYADVDDLERELTKGFKRLKKEVPGLHIPKVYTQISALNESIVISDTLLGISLDKYMGEDYPLYSRFYYPHQCRSMRPERIAPDSFLFYLISEFPLPETSNGNLMEIMIHQGKLYYVVQQILGYTSTENIIDYSAEEKKWCRENRKLIWEYMVKNRQLYATDPMVIRTYTRPVPYTSYFGEGSPSLIGIWMGIEIVSSFMKNNKKMTIQDLLLLTDYDYILSESNFNPR